MEKLIELLNEYEKEKEKSEGLSMYTWEILTGCPIARSNYSDNLLDISEPLIYGKSYGFIKWLVDNDKIDRHSKNLELDMKRIRIPQDYYISGCQSLDLQHKKAQYLSLIALLSIQDKPIEFLISILR